MKDIMNNKKKLLILILVLVGIILITVGLFIFIKEDDKNKEVPNSNETGNQVVEKNPTKLSAFDISSFKVKKNTPNEVNMVFFITNNSKEDIKEETLNINMYNKDKLIYTYHYLIQDLKASAYIYVQANAKFTYDKITKFEFQINDSKVSIEPTYVD